MARAAIAGCTQTRIRGSTLMRSINYASLPHTLLLPFPGFPLGSIHAPPPQLEWSLLAPCQTHVPVDDQHALYVGVLECRMRCHRHVVEEAEAHVVRGLCMVPRGPHDGKGRVHLTTNHSLYSLR